jgi:protein-tyrosine phosphatase|eukprot:COSAG02_NODE_11729_length_1665_cov_8.668367_1_plen_302_part_00
MADAGPVEWEEWGRTSPSGVMAILAARASALDDVRSSASFDSSEDEEDEEEEHDSDDEDMRWSASEIVPGVWVGRKEDAQLPSSLAEHGIGLVISVHDEDQTPPIAKGVEENAIAEGVEWCRLRVEDRADSDLLRHFDTATDRIVEFKRANGSGSGKYSGVLVHCLAGQSRSVAIVAAFLIREHCHSLRDLIEWDSSTQTHGNGLMQRARRGVFPNRGLWRQLVAYETCCLGEASYTEDELPGSIAFDREAIEGVISRFQRRSSTSTASHTVGTAAGLKRPSVEPEVDGAGVAARPQKKNR